MTESKQSTLTLTREGSGINISGEASIVDLLGMVDAMLMLASEKLELPYNEVLKNFEADDENEKETLTLQ